MSSTTTTLGGSGGAKPQGDAPRQRGGAARAAAVTTGQQEQRTSPLSFSAGRQNVASVTTPRLLLWQVTVMSRHLRWRGDKEEIMRSSCSDDEVMMRR